MGDSPGACHGKCVSHMHAHTHSEITGLRAELAAVTIVTVDQEIKEVLQTRVGHLIEVCRSNIMTQAGCSQCGHKNWTNCIDDSSILKRE